MTSWVRLCLALIPLVTPSLARALSIQELVCQQSIGKESLRFLTRAHKASRACRDDEVEGGVCQSAALEMEIAALASQLVEKVTARCGPPIVLEQLGFPALCPDATGPPFDIDELTRCLEEAHRASIENVIAVEYPGSTSALRGNALRCQRTIGSAGGRAFARTLRSRQSCLNDQLSGRISAAPDCRAQLPPAGPGTGVAKTDRRLATTITRLQELLARDCATVALADLGFPGNCADPDGAPFSVDDLIACIRDGHAGAADALLAIEYPAD